MHVQCMLQWHSCPRCSPDVPRPVVVLMPWVWATPRHLDAYISLCHSAGWDALLVRWPMLAMWLPPWSAWLAGRVLRELGGSLAAVGERPVVFWVFSGAAKGVYCSLLRLLAGQRRLSPEQARLSSLVARCSVGQVFDSGPVDFTSEAGKKLLSTLWSGSSSSAGGSRASVQAAAAAAGAAVAGAAGDVAAGLLDFFLLESFEADRADMWKLLQNPPIRGPVLFLYSRNDHLADAAQVSGLATALRLKGRCVLEQIWQDSGHVQHLRSFGAEYRDCLNFLLSKALQEWADSSSRRESGQRLAAAWRQQQQPRGSSGGCSGSAGDGAVGYAGTSVGRTAADGAGQQCLPQPAAMPAKQQQQLVMQPARGILASHAAAARPGCSDSSNSNSSSGGGGCSNRRPQQHSSSIGLAATAARGCLEPALPAAAVPVFGKRRACQPDQRQWHNATAEAGHCQQVRAGVRGVATGSCCGCAASECRCAETFAAAAGEVSCAGDTALSPSLWCLRASSSRVGRQRHPQCGQQQPRHAGIPNQQQQEQQPRPPLMVQHVVTRICSRL